MYCFVCVHIVTSNMTNSVSCGLESSESDLQPISIMPILSKMMEHVIKKQVVGYLDDLLHYSQFGFRSNRSTTYDGVSFFLLILKKQYIKLTILFKLRSSFEVCILLFRVDVLAVNSGVPQVLSWVPHCLLHTPIFCLIVLFVDTVCIFIMCSICFWTI